MLVDQFLELRTAAVHLDRVRCPDSPDELDEPRVTPGQSVARRRPARIWSGVVVRTVMVQRCTLDPSDSLGQAEPPIAGAGRRTVVPNVSPPLPLREG
jgi:hypothetical protein